MQTGNIIIEVVIKGKKAKDHRLYLCVDCMAQKPHVKGNAAVIFRRYLDEDLDTAEFVLSRLLYNPGVSSLCAMFFAK